MLCELAVKDLNFRLFIYVFEQCFGILDWIVIDPQDSKVKIGDLFDEFFFVKEVVGDKRKGDGVGSKF